MRGFLAAAQRSMRKTAVLCPPGKISLAVLEDSVANVSRFSPFQLVAAIYQHTDGGEGSKAARIYRMLEGMKAEGEAPPLILWVLSNEVRMLMRLRGFTRGGRRPHPSHAGQR